MTQRPNKISIEKKGLHPRNRHRFRYNFKELISSCPELAPFVSINKFNAESIDFANPVAVKALNSALLKHFYGIANWDIPANYLCPPIPGRADYIHYMADLLAACNDGIIPTGKQVTVLDIGVGANCVYPIIGVSEYGWCFIGSDTDMVAIQSAKQIADSNNTLTGSIELRQQLSSLAIFKGIVLPGDVFDVSICNPPFHSSREEAQAGTQRKWRNLGKNKGPASALNFGGQPTELWCPGGEVTFIERMIEESNHIAEQCFWFTTLVSNSSHLRNIHYKLNKAGAFDVRTIDMVQGQKTSRIVAWTFFNKQRQKEWQMKRWRLHR